MEIQCIGLDGMEKLKAELRFGDTVENGWASEDNPHRKGTFVKWVHNDGDECRGINNGLCIELTDGNGSFWQNVFDKDAKLKRVTFQTIAEESLTSLKRYFEETPKEQIQKDWEEIVAGLPQDDGEPDWFYDDDNWLSEQLKQHAVDFMTWAQNSGYASGSAEHGQGGEWFDKGGEGVAMSNAEMYDIFEKHLKENNAGNI